MPINNKRKIEKRRLELLRHIRTCEYNKERIIKHARLLDYSYDRDLIDYKEYKENRNIEGKTPESWIKYYDEQIKCYNNELDRYNVSENNVNPILVLSLLFLVFASTLAVFNYKEGITGFVVQDLDISNETLANETIEQINETLPIELDNVDATPPINLEANISESITEKIPAAEPVIKISVPVEPALIENEETIQGKAEINKPVKWNKKIKLEKKTNNLEIELPEVSKNITIIKKENGENIEIDENNVKIEKDGHVIEAVDSNLISGEAIFNLDNRNWIESLITWIKQLTITGYATVEFDDVDSNITLIIEEEIEEIEIEYETPGPSVNEKEINSYKKEIVVYSEIHYENVTAYTFINNIPLERINLYKTTGEIREQVQFTSKDEDSNSLIDYIEWTVPSLSNQTYELIIEISAAEHLDENRTFISDIYTETSKLDNIWSEPIPAGHYVRVTFEQNLTSDRDITIYPRIISGSPKIEIYEKDGTNSIAEILHLKDKDYNKFFLINLNGTQDTFDLHLLEGSIEIDHIIDPVNVAFSDDFETDLTKWDGNGATAWDLTTAQFKNGAQSVTASNGNEGDFITDDIDTSSATLINVSFWFMDDDLDGSDIDIYFFDGTAYDLIDTALGTQATEDTWAWTNRTTSDSQYFISNFRVRFSAVLGNGEQLWIDDFSVNITTTTNTAPTLPVLHKPDNNTQAALDTLTVQLNWSNSSDAEGNQITYYLEVWNDSGATAFMYANASITERTNVTSALVTFSNETNDYFWRVLASDGSLNSSFTGLRNITIQINRYPVTPSLHKPDNNTLNSFNILTAILNWSNSSDPDGDALTYYLEVWNDSGATEFLFANSSIKEIQNTTSANVTFPNQTNDYFWRVLASDGKLNSSWTGLRNISIKVNRYPGIPNLHKPDNNSIAYLDTLLITFNWSNSSDPDGNAITYYLEVWNDSAATEFMYANTSITERTNVTSALITFPNETNDYFWRVLANDGSLNSSFTGLRNITIQVNRHPTRPQLNAPLNSTIMPVNKLETKLNWSNSSDTDGNQINYYLEIWNNSDLTGFMYANASIRETANVTIANVTFPNETNDYFWRVLASDGRLNSSWSDAWNITINVTAVNAIPQITSVAGIPAVSPTENSAAYVTFSFTARDADGTANLNSTSGEARFQRTGEQTRVNYSCAKVGNLDSTTANFSCLVDIWYFDGAGNWTVNITIKDAANNRAENSSTELEFMQLTAMRVSPSSIAWPSLDVLDTNVSSDTAINMSNTGNKNIANGSVTLTGIDLSGEITKIERIFVGNISITHVSGLQCSNNNATLLFNNTAKPIRPNGTLPRGNNTLNLGTLNMTICLREINNSITAQKYSTNGSGTGQEWTFTIS